MTNLQKRIATKLMAVGANPSFEGYRALAIAAEYCYENPSAIRRITQDVYPQVANIMNKTPSQVERNIRHIIEKIYSFGDYDALKTEGLAPYNGKDKLTNGEFIGILAENLRIEETVEDVAPNNSTTVSTSLGGRQTNACVDTRNNAR